MLLTLRVLFPAAEHNARVIGSRVIDFRAFLAAGSGVGVVVDLMVVVEVAHMQDALRRLAGHMLATEQSAKEVFASFDSTGKGGLKLGDADIARLMRHLLPALEEEEMQVRFRFRKMGPAISNVLDFIFPSEPEKASLVKLPDVVTVDLAVDMASPIHRS